MGTPTNLRRCRSVDQPQQPPNKLNKPSGNLNCANRIVFRCRFFQISARLLFLSLLPCRTFFTFSFSSFCRTNSFTKQQSGSAASRKHCSYLVGNFFPPMRILIPPMGIFVRLLGTVVSTSGARNRHLSILKRLSAN